MKRKFKLKKAYPGYKIPLDIEIESESETGYFSENPEFWEEVVEKDYEILSFALKNAYKLGTSIRFKNKWGLFPSDNTLKAALNSTKNEFSEEELLKDKDYYIHSIKRLSDGEVFTIGDTITSINWVPVSGKNSDILSEININSEFMFKTKIAWQCHLSETQHVKKPLFTTEDKVDIFEGDKYFYTNTSFLIIDTIAEKSIDYTREGNVVRFSTKEKAEEYIFLNKPSLSIQDLLSIQRSQGCLGDSLIGFAKEFVKSKK